MGEWILGLFHIVFLGSCVLFGALVGFHLCGDPGSLFGVMGTASGALLGLCGYFVAFVWLVVPSAANDEDASG